MTKQFPLVALNEVLSPVSRQEKVDLVKEYFLVGVRLDGKGPFLRESRLGSQTSAMRLFRIEKGDFIYSRLFAWRGAFGIIDSSLDGYYVSGEFPTFLHKREKIDIRYLKYWFTLPSTLERVFLDCSGSTPLTRNRYKEQFFLSLQLPLPPLDEQQRIVSRIEELATKIEEARGLRKQAVEEREALVQSHLRRFFLDDAKGWAKISMSDAIIIDNKQVDPTLPEYSILPHISGENIEKNTCRLLPYRSAEADNVKSGNYLFFPNTILYSKIRPYLRKAVYVDFQGVCSADIYPIKVNQEKLQSKFLMWSLIASPFTEYANRLSGRTRMPKLNRKQLFSFVLTCPQLEEQRRIVAALETLQSKVKLLRDLQEETSKELNALLPSLLDKAFKGEL